MRVVVRMILATLACVTSAVTCVACSGGGGGTSAPQGPPPPPPPAFANTLDTGLAIGLRYDDIAVIGNDALVLVSEPETGLDLNDDGDQIDVVAHHLDIATNVSTNLRLAVRGRPIASDQLIAFLVPEADQGADLNGDTDLGDAVWHILDPPAPVGPGAPEPNPSNTTFATPLFGAPGIGAAGGLVLVVSEVAMGIDLSGDGDAFDEIAAAVGPAGLTPLPLSIPPYARGTRLVARGNRVLICGSEASAGLDLNGDLDATDTVLGVLTFEGQSVPTYRPAGPGLPRAIDPSAYELTDTTAVYLASERDGGMTDINGDTDANDSILTVLLIETGAELFPTDTTVSFFPLAANISTGIATSGSRVIFGIDEKGQQKDLNIDQDQVDSILTWFDANSPFVAYSVGLTLGSQPPQIDGSLGLVSINEAASALVTGVDLNADGDVSDQVAFRIDMAGAPAVLRNLGLAVEAFTLSRTDAILMVSEAAQSQSDRNGDTDTRDIVPAYGDLAAPSPAFRSLGVATFGHTLYRVDQTTIRIAVVMPEQPLTTYADLNADGDSDDSAYLWFDLNTSVLPAFVLPPTPYLIGMGGFSRVPPIRVDDDTFLFATSEVLASVDLNGDNDQNDTLLRIVRRAPPQTGE